jgi:hypothetical protein
MKELDMHIANILWNNNCQTCLEVELDFQSNMG